jgi:hypothetical protein
MSGYVRNVKCALTGTADELQGRCSRSHPPEIGPSHHRVGHISEEEEVPHGGKKPGTCHVVREDLPHRTYHSQGALGGRKGGGRESRMFIGLRITSKEETNQVLHPVV